MRLHSNSADALDVRKAATLAGVAFTRFDLKGSRSHAQAFDVILTGSSHRRQNTRGRTDDMAATWDEWGMFLGHLFDLDPAMVATGAYESGEHFHWATGGRYRRGSLHPSTQHANHNWEWTGHSAGGAYSCHECECGAVRRFIGHTRFATFAEFQAANA
jgi:hypothetical protein